MNAVTLTGNLVADPQLVVLESGAKVCNFRIGQTEWVDGKPVENGFFDIRAWNALGENCQAALAKGELVIVTGRANHRTFENPDQSIGSRTTITALAVGLALNWPGASRVRKARTQEDEAPPEGYVPLPVEAKVEAKPAPKTRAAKK